MTPEQIINEVIVAYGQFANRKDHLFNILKGVVKEYERSVFPKYCITEYEETITSGSRKEDIFISGGFGVVSVTINDNGTYFPLIIGDLQYVLFKDSLNKNLYCGIRVEDDGIRLMFPQDGLGSDSNDVTVSILYYKHTSITSIDTDYPELDFLYDKVKVGLLYEVAKEAKDLERLGAFEKEWYMIIGREVGGART